MRSGLDDESKNMEVKYFSLCKVVEVGISLVCWKNSKKVSVGGVLFENIENRKKKYRNILKIWVRLFFFNCEYGSWMVCGFFFSFF